MSTPTGTTTLAGAGGHGRHADGGRRGGWAAGADGAAELEWAARGLGPDAARVLRLIGVHPGPSADAGAVAALAGLSRSAARAALDRLAAGRLLDRTGDRYALTEPLRAYAADQPDATLARDRLLQHLAGTARAAVAMGHPYPGGPAVALPPFGTAEAARAWLEAELPTLLAVPDPAFALRLSPVLGDHLPAADALRLHRRALAAGGGAAARVRVGAALRRLGRDPEAAEQFRIALADRPDPAAEAEARRGLGELDHGAGRYARAREQLTRALAGFRALGRPADEAGTLAALGAATARLGDGAAALRHYRAAAGLLGSLGDRDGQRRVLAAAGAALLRLGRCADAAEELRRCLPLCARPADRVPVLLQLGACRDLQGRRVEAMAWYAEAYGSAVAAGDRVGRAAALRRLGVLRPV